VTLDKTSRQQTGGGGTPTYRRDSQSDDSREIVEDEAWVTRGNIPEDNRHEQKVRPEDDGKDNREETMIGIPKPSDAMQKH
jgi:hypothetical protein